VSLRRASSHAEAFGLTGAVNAGCPVLIKGLAYLTRLSLVSGKKAVRRYSRADRLQEAV
jgi:hypothetical protein